MPDYIFEELTPKSLRDTPEATFGLEIGDENLRDFS